MYILCIFKISIYNNLTHVKCKYIQQSLTSNWKGFDKATMQLLASLRSTARLLPLPCSIINWLNHLKLYFTLRSKYFDAIDSVNCWQWSIWPFSISQLWVKNQVGFSLQTPLLKKVNSFLSAAGLDMKLWSKYRYSSFSQRSTLMLYIDS